MDTNGKPVKAFWSLVLVPVGLVWFVVWETIAKTSSASSEEERIRGWSVLWRESPGSIPLLGIVGLGFILAVRAGRQGALQTSLRAIWAHGAALFFVLWILFAGAAEDIMTTRSATVKWLLFPLQVGLAALAVFAARRKVKKSR